MSPALAGAAVTGCLITALVGVRMARSTPAAAASLVDTGPARRRRSLAARVTTALGRRLGPPVLRTMSERRIALIRHRLDAAGHPGGLTLEGYAARKASTTALFAAGSLLLMLAGSTPVLAAPLALLGWLSVDFSLAGQARRRQHRIDRDLPDFLDVLTITVGAGLGFRNALRRVSEELGGPVAEEVRIVLRQMSLGASRRAAFEGLRERTDSEQLGQFVTAFLQAEELGTPLGDGLVAIARDMRKAFAQKARRDAARAAPKVSLVLTTVAVPGALILLLTGVFLSADIDLGGLFG